MLVNGTRAIHRIEALLQSNWLPEEAIKAFEQAVEIIKDCDVDSCTDGITTIFLADGNELSPHLWEEYETVENATVHLNRCAKCGAEDVWWERNNG